MTIREIANLAGVSPAAVSLVINHKKGVSEETRRRVQSVIEENNYIVPGQKRTGKPKRFRLCVIKFRTHGIALEENQGFIASIIDQIESECRHYGYDLAMVNCEVATAEETLKEVMASPPEGIILMGTELSENDKKLLNLLTVPTVVLDHSMRDVHVDSVVMDNEAVSAEAVRYLHDLGYAKIGYFCFSIPISNCEERYLGYRREMERLGLPVPPPVRITPTLNGSYKDMKRLLDEGKYVPQGAAVADNDTVAIGVMKAIREAGYRIPEDISIIGVDDIPFSAMTMPALTTMRISRSAMGTLAVDTLRKRIKYPNWPSMHMRLAGRLVVRGSTIRSAEE
ncbi:MAG: substrate-binding domain-containing protein [Candidatus Limiplasma sp.]|nr:substrate-binding domain-containing protein [Candidatus Limiplasma sp.]MEA5146806.1 substrate-binding domain-containing protein [Candidatus Limiplasma sp.]